MTIIVLEGPDMAGKTTLATYLATSLHGTKVRKQGPPTGDILETYLRPIEEWSASPHTSTSGHLILDRWHMGELVYGPLLRGKSQLTERQADYIDMVLQTFGCIFLHVTAPLNVLEDRYDIRGDTLIKRDQLHDIQVAYESLLWRRSHWVKTTVSYDTKWDIRQMIQSPMAGRYIGPPRPSVLLLGDSRASDRFIFPFVPAKATSGHWLMGAMATAGVNHMNVGIFNACEIAWDDLYLQWRQLGRPPVITLGRNAQKVWHQNGVAPESTYLHHPQYMRRFHYLQFAEYGQKIKEIMHG